MLMSNPGGTKRTDNVRAFSNVKDVIEARCQKRLSSSITAGHQMRDTPTIIATAQTHNLFLTTVLEGMAVRIAA